MTQGIVRLGVGSYWRWRALIAIAAVLLLPSPRVGAASLYVGYSGSQTITQTTGVRNVGAFGWQDNLYLGYNTGASGTYNLSGTGQLKVWGNEYVGYSGTGTFVQLGGMHTLNPQHDFGAVYLGYNPGSSGTYILSGTAQLSAMCEYVASADTTGLFQHTSGTNAVQYLSIGIGGQYQLSGGMLHVTGGIDNAGVLDGNDAFAEITGTDCILNFGPGTMRNVGAVSVSVNGAGSLVILPAGFDPSTGFKSYRCDGLTHTEGTTLTIVAGRTVTGWGSINDLVNCQGTMTAALGGSGGTARCGAINLNGGMVLAGNTSVDLGLGKVTVNGTESSMDSGTLSMSRIYVGRSGSGTFTQTGGMITSRSAPSVYLGFYAGDSGTYNLSGSGVTKCQVEVGFYGTGTFTQTGGINFGSVEIGNQPAAVGTYNLSGSGAVSSYFLAVGGHGTGTFLQTGGTIVTKELMLAYFAGSSGTYNLNAGVLTLSALNCGSGTVAFSFNGGIMKAGASFSSSVPITLATNNGKATVDTGGYTITLSGALSGAGNLVKTGGGGLVFSGANTYTGSTTVDDGALSVTGSLNSNSALVVGGGTFSYTPVANNGTGNIQSVAGLTVTAGASGVKASTGNTLALGAVTRDTGGTVNFNNDTAGTITTTRANTHDILGVWATYGSGTSMKYAMASGSVAPCSIRPYTDAIAITDGVDGLRDTAGTINYCLSSGGGKLTAAVTANSLQFAGTANTISIAADHPFSLNGMMNIGSGTVTLTGGNLVIGDTKELVCTGMGDFTVDAVIRDNGSGPSAVTMATSGTLVLANANTYSGGTTLSAGTLNLSHAAALGTGPLTITGGTIDNISGTPMTLSNSISQIWSGAFTFKGSAALNLGTAPVTLRQDTVINVGANALFVGGPIRGPGSLAKAGPGILALQNSNTHSGGTLLSNGILQLGNAAALGVGAFTINGGTIDNTNGEAMTLSNNCPLNWNGSFTFSGSDSLDLGNGLVAMNANITITVNAKTLAVGGVVVGEYSLTKSGAGTLTLSGANAFAQGATLAAGQLNLNSTAALGSGSFTISGTSTIDNTSGSPVVLSNNNSQEWKANFTFAGTQDLDLGSGPVTLSGSRTITVNASTLTVGGSISGNYSLTKAGSGTLALDGENVYTGGTTISAGRLALNGSLVSPTTVQNGCTLSGSGRAGTVTVNSGGHLAPGSSIGTISLTGNLSLLSGALLEFELGPASASDQIVMPGKALTLSGQDFSTISILPQAGFGPGTYVLIDAGSLAGTGLGSDRERMINGLTARLAVDDASNDLVLNVIPEPSTLALLGAGAISLVCCYYRRRQRCVASGV